MTDKKQRTANVVLAIGGLNGFDLAEEQNSISVLRFSFRANMTPITNMGTVNVYLMANED